jgi:hypothetical protein
MRVYECRRPSFVAPETWPQSLRATVALFIATSMGLTEEELC